MKIRTYITKERRSTRGPSTSQGGYEVDYVDEYVEKEIIDWELFPEHITEQWKPGTPIPSSKNITVTFPQLFLLHVYRQYANPDQWRYSIELEENDFVELVVPEGKRFDAITRDVINELPKRKLNFQIRYKNFDKLSYDPTKVTIKIKTFAQAENESEKAITQENKEITISLQKTDSESPQTPTVPVLNMVYNTVSKELSGDTSMQFFSDFRAELCTFLLNHFFNDDLPRLRYGEASDFKAGLFVVNFSAVGSRRELKFISIDESNFSNGTYKGIDFTQNQTIRTQANENWLFEELLYNPSNRFDRTKSHNFIINLTITNDASFFEINKKTFEYELFREDKRKATGQFVIKNPNRLTFTFEKSDALTLNVSGNGTEQVTVSFESKTADTFRVGTHRTYVKVTGSPENEQIVSVLLHIKQNVDFDAREIYFCKDKNVLKIRKFNPESEFARATLTMHFSGYGQAFQNTQRYDYVFFEEYVSIDIGQEVQDFFEDIPSLEVLNISENKILQPREIFKAARVDVSIVETNFKGETFKTHTFNDLHYLPGKKPEAFPFLTRATLRSTYGESLVSVCALTRDVKVLNLNEIASNLADLSLLKDTLGVANFAFRRSVADKTYGATNIISKTALSLEPKPESNELLIDAVFQNQNFCPDWFSFAGNYEVLINIEHTITDNVLKSEDYKAFVKTKRTFKLNTGWIFPEEVELLWELIQSPLCYLKINGKWTKVIPITQKPLSFDSYRNLHNMIVEFQLADK